MILLGTFLLALIRVIYNEQNNHLKTSINNINLQIIKAKS